MATIQELIAAKSKLNELIDRQGHLDLIPALILVQNEINSRDTSYARRDEESRHAR